MSQAQGHRKVLEDLLVMYNDTNCFVTKEAIRAIVFFLNQEQQFIERSTRKNERIAQLEGQLSEARKQLNGIDDDAQQKLPEPINCDVVSWIIGILDRYRDAVREKYSRVSKLKDTAQLSALLEIMDILDLKFADADAAGNALYKMKQFNELRGLGTDVKESR